MEFVLGRFSHFNIAIAYSNSTFCGAWTPSFCEFTWKLPKFKENEHTPGMHSCLFYIYRYYCLKFICCQMVISLGCARFAEILSELTKTWSSGATESRVWIGNCNVKVWKSTEHKLHNIWPSVNFQQNEHTPGNIRVFHRRANLLATLCSYTCILVPVVSFSICNIWC